MLSRNYTDEVVNESYKQLEDLKVNTYVNSNAGNKALDKYFWDYRVKTKTGKWSKYSAWNNPEQRAKIMKSWRTLYPKSSKPTAGEIQGTLNMRYGSVNQFKPATAKYIYNKFKPTRILDFSAGWGGRMLGAMVLGIDYIGIDSNKRLSVPYKNVISKFGGKSNVRMIFKKAEDVDVSNMNYDMVFTSPPYGMLEQYEGMKNYDNFNEQFLKPVIEKTYKHLKKGGTYILNIPADIYKYVKTILGSATSKILLKKAQRTGAGGGYKEYIYIWKKV